jgi:hypothetical protein
MKNPSPKFLELKARAEAARRRAQNCVDETAKQVEIRRQQDFEKLAEDEKRNIS